MAPELAQESVISVITKLRNRVHDALEVSENDDLFSRIIDFGLIGLITLNVLAIIIESIEAIAVAYQPHFKVFELVSVAIFSVEYVLRVWICVDNADGKYRGKLIGRLRYMASPMALVDLIVILPFYLSFIIGIDLRVLRILRLLRILKLTRYSGAWALFAAVLYGQRRTLYMSGFLMIIMLVLSASLMYLIEHDAQPVAFADIPSAMWWSLVTLTTVGYGDVTPVTILGKVLGGFVTILGLGMYALPAAILASGFMQELSKRQFVVTWGMVAKVPFFGSLDAQKIAEIAALLKPSAVPARYTIIRRGEAADSMYFIVSGDVEVDLPPSSFHLTTGEYFGEMGIVNRSARVANVISITECQLLILQARDLNRLMEDNPALAGELTELTERRLAESESFETQDEKEP
ncbi:MAG: cyclic nucleotide-gated ion channel [Proteobacteria bacterium]|nr:cyclic nucleotide-gated ion channel [Pseudomonadota bacterium]MDA1356693.1 cyclic nucleotide-gated ion channel [Pseudomonadota bacterium]